MQPVQGSNVNRRQQTPTLQIFNCIVGVANLYRRIGFGVIVFLLVYFARDRLSY